MSCALASPAFPWHHHGDDRGGAAEPTLTTANVVCAGGAGRSIRVRAVLAAAGTLGRLPLASSGWHALGPSGKHIHAIAFTRRDGHAVSLCSYELPIRETSEDLPPCPECSKKLRMLIDGLPENSTV
jgi:hypothetical protein